MTASRNYRACGALATRIEETLRLAPCTVRQLCERLAASHASIRLRLDDMMVSGRVHYVETATFGGRGLAYVWHLGAASQEQLDEVRRKQAARADVIDRGPIGIPCQVTTRAYVPTNRRDPLVAALFGPAACSGAKP
jgi:hypothetical protein